MKSEKPNLSAIAQALGVSVATVSNALSGKGRVSSELAERIRDTAHSLGYVPSVAGRALRTGRSGVLGLVLPDIANPLFPQIAQAIEHAASAAGYGVLIGDSRGAVEQQTQAILRLIDRGVDGIIIIPRRGTRIADIGCPVAVIDTPATPGNTVASDHWAGGEEMGRHLRVLGHRSVLILAGSALSNVQNDRVGGLRAGLGPDVRADVLWLERHAEAEGAEAPLGLAARVRQGVTAFAALSDLTAVRALTELQAAGIAVPAAASVTGFDDLIWSSVITPSLTTLRMDMGEIARQAVQALAAVIEDLPHGQVTALGTVVAERAAVPMKLMLRQSSGPCPAERELLNGDEQ
ncbi:LacI family DNA-binding transcriptional regulator [Rhizobium sp. CSW-27]|uniref:LacI family DNA-binding transcriptional regulator n=1 Tax=Rhizobium sp. CSW-27 TaxID=2839985 RepID=UPI001C017A49|nr:LacI family DNA-binding transcriptional regulator [Rhizobium sp. CSW-27]MBT9369046.1 LacI family transcriptional regulator [Rhizobium sp. CSW-27]